MSRSRQMLQVTPAHGTECEGYRGCAEEKRALPLPVLSHPVRLSAGDHCSRVLAAPSQASLLRLILEKKMHFILKNPEPAEEWKEQYNEHPYPKADFQKRYIYSTRLPLERIQNPFKDRSVIF